MAPNPTGSTGWGQQITDDIQNDWGEFFPWFQQDVTKWLMMDTGGAPYEDLVKCWEHIKAKFPYIDTDNGIAAGASFGGFMVNWIQGKPLGRKFKALVSHDGTFVAPAKIATDELFFMEHDVCIPSTLATQVLANNFLV